MALPAALLSAHSQLAALGIRNPACLARLRDVLAFHRGIHISQLDTLHGHGIWLDTGNLTVVIVSPDTRTQLHDLAHVLLEHLPQPAIGFLPPPFEQLQGRSVDGRVAGFTPEQETDAEIASQALLEFVSP